MELEPLYHPDYVLENLDFFGDNTNDIHILRNLRDSNFYCNRIISSNNNNSGNNSVNNNINSGYNYIHSYSSNTSSSSSGLSSRGQFEGDLHCEMPKHKRNFFRSVTMRLPNSSTLEFVGATHQTNPAPLGCSNLQQARTQLKATPLTTLPLGFLMRTELRGKNLVMGSFFGKC
ncbi:hypothetical protein PoB_003763300 [Plakobranchus ocellatus]|uniref:Uncharacterized protein n=1 Tax=Plakobranchus ocellatus TaxID=259542 RepID=A0AAV4AX89_9GAST|nr:hypothetical protein PoB_003763300 [Plakobranchus ocellatus]